MSPLDYKGDYVPDDEIRPDAAVASAARTASGTSAPFNVGTAHSLEATLTVTAAAGTGPTLDVVLETSMDAGVTWTTVGAFPQQTAAGAAGRIFGPLGDRARWRWTLAGTTPSFTFGITAEANR